MHTQLLPTPKGLTLGGVLLAKRAPDGSCNLSVREEERLEALLTAAWERPVPAKALGYIKHALQLFAEISDDELEHANFARPERTHTQNDAPLIAKMTMLLALSGFRADDPKAKLEKAMEFIDGKGVHPRIILKAFGKYSPDQPRDYHGRWTEGGGDASEAMETDYIVTTAENAKPMAYETTQAVTETNSDQKQKFDVDGAIEYLDQKAEPGPTDYCARYVANAIEQGGNIDGGQRPRDAKDFGPWLENVGFTSVVNADAESGNSYPPAGYTPRAGDVAVIMPDPDGNPSGHMTMYDGTQWVSDFKQMDIWGGRGRRRYKPAYVIYRH